MAKKVLTPNTAMGASGPGHAPGFVPDPGSTPGTNRFLREDAAFAALTAGNIPNIAESQVTGLTADLAAKLTQLTGDVTAGPGGGSQPATLVNTTVTAGAYTNANVTFDAKGRATAAASGTTPALVKIGQVVITSAGPTITFSSIPATFTNLLLKGYARSTAGSSGVSVSIGYNGDTGTNYNTNYWLTLQGTGSGGAITSASSAFLGNVPGSGDNAGSAGAISLQIIGYAGTTFKKQGVCQSWGVTGALTSRLLLLNSGHEWESTVAINSITLTIGTGNFAVGSTFTLYGET